MILIKKPIQFSLITLSLLASVYTWYSTTLTCTNQGEQLGTSYDISDSGNEHFSCPVEEIHDQDCFYQSYNNESTGTNYINLENYPKEQPFCLIKPDPESTDPDNCFNWKISDYTKDNVKKRTYQWDRSSTCSLVIYSRTNNDPYSYH